MSRKVAAILVVLLAAFFVAATTLYLMKADVAVLQPAGTIAEQQKNLLIFASLLSLLVILPVFALTFYITYTYRATNKKAKYRPDWQDSKRLETIWWGIPIILIIILGVVIWTSSHKLDPYRPLESDKKAVTVQVVSLQWKWLFIYPEQGIATVNYLQIPEGTPINFELTADSPMNSLWIPKLGGQVYAMNGMQTKLHLMADTTGTYRGMTTNISGEGYADMTFDVESVSEKNFTDWVQSVKQKDLALSSDVYSKLAQPSRKDPPLFYSTVQPELFTDIMHKYMPEMTEKTHNKHSAGDSE